MKCMWHNLKKKKKKKKKTFLSEWGGRVGKAVADFVLWEFNRKVIFTVVLMQCKVKVTIFNVKLNISNMAA